MAAPERGHGGAVTRIGLLVLGLAIGACSARTIGIQDGSLADRNVTTGIDVDDAQPDSGILDLVQDPGDVASMPPQCTQDCECPNAATGNWQYCENGVCTPTPDRPAPPRGVCNDDSIAATGKPVCLCVGDATCVGRCCRLPDGSIADPDGPNCRIPCQRDCQCPPGTGICLTGYCGYSDLGPQGLCGPDSAGTQYPCACQDGTCVDRCCYLPDGGLAETLSPQCQP
jgi:hypothetical protein